MQDVRRREHEKRVHCTHENPTTLAGLPPIRHKCCDPRWKGYRRTCGVANDKTVNGGEWATVNGNDSADLEQK